MSLITMEFILNNIEVFHVYEIQMLEILITQKQLYFIHASSDTYICVTVYFLATLVVINHSSCTVEFSDIME